jgi:hypothetical protein
MPSVTLTNDQVLELIKQLPPQQKRDVLLALAGDAQARRDSRTAFAESQLRQRAAERGLRWDDLTEDQREAFVDDLLHESS